MYIYIYRKKEEGYTYSPGNTMTLPREEVEEEEKKTKYDERMKYYAFNE